MPIEAIRESRGSGPGRDSRCVLQCSIPARGGFPILKSLDISGFKSFAKNTRLEFAPGITALVGPNGSGKSNVVDAVRWCLGEQSVRDLRGQRAEDVIYAGRRKILGAAEVTLTFEQTVSDENGSEMSIGRRLYRSGDSEYLINQRRVRLRDVLTALHDVDIDEGRYIVVNQGMADFLLSATPQERRALLEQAAGLGSYRRQRDDARQKLSTTQHNIETIEAVLVELEPRVRLLRRQARAVEDREEAQLRLRTALETWYSATWKTRRDEVHRLTLECNRAADQRGRAVAEMEKLEREAETVLERERRWQKDVEDAVSRAHETQRALDAARHGLNLMEQQVTRNTAAIIDARQRRAHLEAARREAAARRDSEREAVAEMEKERFELEQEAQIVHDSVVTLREAMTDSERATASINATRRDLEEKHAACLRQETQLSDHIKIHVGQRSAAADWLRTCADRVEALESELEAAGAKCTAAAASEAAAARAVADMESRVRRVRRRRDRLIRVCSQLRDDTARLLRREANLNRLLSSLEDENNIHVLRSIVVSPGWEMAVASALDDWLSGGWRRTAAHDGDSTRQTALIAWRSSLEQCVPTALAWVDSLVSRVPAEGVLPLLACAVAEDDDQARRLWQELAELPARQIGDPPVTVVSRSGMRWGSLGSRVQAQDDRTARYLQAKRDLTLAGKRRAERERWLIHATTARDESSTELSSLEQQLIHANGELQDAKRLLGGIELSIERLTQTLSDLHRERAERERANREVEARIESLDRERSETEAHVARLVHELSSTAERSTKAGEAGKELAANLSNAMSQAQEVRQRADLASQNIALLHRGLESLDRELRRLDADIAGLISDEDELNQVARRLEASIEEERLEVETLHRRWETADQNVAILRTQRPTADPQTSRLREIRSEASDLVSHHERLSARLSEAQREQEALTLEIVREVGAEPDDLPECDSAVPTMEEIRRLRTRAAQYADLDQSAVTEYRELAERERYLRHHVHDLQTAAATLAQVMAMADHEMRGRFHSAFGAVNEEFGRVFTVMLRGGEASLEQMEDGGIDVRARLPGRRARSSAAFSGGERALVASSLLFGVLNIRPTPFCILDEVDAALDESNVDRYLAALRDISASTQTIVVTHNRATMAAADILYGLTMDDEGVSGLLSLRLETYGAAV